MTMRTTEGKRSTAQQKYESFGGLVAIHVGVCDLEIMALTEKYQEKVQVCEKRIVGVKRSRVFKRRMDELRVDVGEKNV